MTAIRVKNILSLVFNVLTVVFVVKSISEFLIIKNENSIIWNLGNPECYKYFTNDSNIFAALCALLVVPFNIISIVSGENAIPKWALMFKFAGTTAVTLTLMVVILYLNPIVKFQGLFDGSGFYLHLVCPLLCIISFCFFENCYKFSMKETLLCVLPMVIYGMVYLINVIFTKVWHDFYCFNIGGYWYIVYFVMIAVTYIFALALRFLHNIGVK